MRVQELLPLGRKSGRRFRRALPKTMDAIQSRVERIGSDVAERWEGVTSRLKSSAALSSARKALRRGGERTATWVKENPAALPLVGLGGALAMLLLRNRRQARQPKFFRGAMRMMAAAPLLRKGLGLVVGRLMGWATSPRKPHVFRAVTVKW